MAACSSSAGSVDLADLATMLAGDVRRRCVHGRMRENSPVAGRRRDHADVLHRDAQVAVLSRLARGEDDVFALMTAVLPYDVRGHFTPDVALLEVAAAALGVACPPGAERLEYEGLTDRYLNDLMLERRTLRRRTQYALYAAACTPTCSARPATGNRSCGRTPSRRSSCTAGPPRTAPAGRWPRSRSRSPTNSASRCPDPRRRTDSVLSGVHAAGLQKPGGAGGARIRPGFVP